MEFEKKSLVELRAIAKENGIRKITALKKQELIDVLKAYFEEHEAWSLH